MDGRKDVWFQGGMARQHPGEILVVEDELVNQKVVLGMLHRLGFSPDAAGNGLEALQAIEQRHYDLVFMVYQMPILNGCMTTARIRQAEGTGTRHLPVVVLTANALVGDSARCLEAGMDDYLPKPLCSDTLAGELHRWLLPQAARGGNQTRARLTGGENDEGVQLPHRRYLEQHQCTV